MTFQCKKLNTIIIGFVIKLEMMIIREDLYPSLDDMDFNSKLTKYKDFTIKGTIHSPKNVKELEALSNSLCNSEIELSPYQLLVRNYLSNETPYNGLLLYHGLGTGKTCSAITIAEEHRSFLKQSGLKQKIYILGGNNIKTNFKQQLFNESYLIKKGGEWTCKSCIGNAILREVNPDNQMIDKDILVSKIEVLIKQYYKFMGYIEFSHLVEDKRKGNKLSDFENCMIIIDEIHNIKENEVTDTLKPSQALDLIVDHTTVKLLLLSATPMFNDSREIIWIINLLRKNDKKSTLQESDFFKQDVLDDTKKEDFIHIIRGYVSFVKGENPFTFPYRIYPTPTTSPTKSLLDGKKISPLRTKVTFVNMSKYQHDQYTQLIKTAEKSDQISSFSLKDFDSISTVLNMTYPNSHQTNVSSYMQKNNQTYSYKQNTEECFHIDHLQKYSAKLYAICKSIQKSTGIVLVYTKFVTNGLIPAALALESMGYHRYGNKQNFLQPSKPKIGHYCVMTGSDLSDSEKTLMLLNSPENKYGDLIKVVLITNAASEGVDFKNIRQIHIMDPWWHMNRIEQIIGRGIRLCSHKNLPFEERNAQIFLYVTYFGEVETVDHYLYRYAEEKAYKIGKVSRILKENAIDCEMNLAQMKSHFLDFKVPQKLSNGEMIDHKLNDNSYSVMCDFMECNYTCNYVSSKSEIDSGLEHLNYMIEKIRPFFRYGYMYTAEEIFKQLNLSTTYVSYTQIYQALHHMIDVKTECKDMLNRTGYLINREKYYLFQPKHLPLQSTMYERRIPPNVSNHSIIIKPEEPIVDKSAEMIIKDMHESYKKTQKSFKVAVGNEWCELIPQIKPIVEKHSFKDMKVDEQDYDTIIIAHIVESLNYKDCFTLVNYLFFNKLNEFEEKIKSYFKVIQNKYLKLWNDTTVITLEKNETWEKTLGLETPELTYDFAHIVGGIANKSDEIRTLKTKRMVDKTSTGQVCENASLNGNITAAILPRLNEILGDTYPSLTRDKACCITEVVLRMLQLKKYQKKTWFLNAVEVIEYHNQRNTPIKLLKSRIHKV
jgi:superfamily II DNA or RNA helicase